MAIDVYKRQAHNVAQKVTGIIKLQIPAGKATPAPPVGPALGQHGVNTVSYTHLDVYKRQSSPGHSVRRGLHEAFARIVWLLFVRMPRCV